MAPTVSVIIPTYDRVVMLEEAITSVRAQTYQDWELIVIGDQATPATTQRIEEWCRRDARIRFAPNTGKGASAARNHGLRLAQGRLVAFLDDDDLWLPEKLSQQVARFAARPELALVYVRCWFEERVGDIERVGQPLPLGRRYRDLYLNNKIWTSSLVMVRRDDAIAQGGFDERMRYGEDYKLWLRIAARHPVDAIDEPLAVYRRHGGSLTMRWDYTLGGVIAAIRRAPLLDGVTRMDRRRRLGTVYFRMAQDQDDRGEWANAARSFWLAGWHWPTVGLEQQSWRSSRPLYRLSRPWRGALSCGLKSLRR